MLWLLCIVCRVLTAHFGANHLYANHGWTRFYDVSFPSGPLPIHKVNVAYYAYYFDDLRVRATAANAKDTDKTEFAHRLATLKTFVLQTEAVKKEMKQKKIDAAAPTTTTTTRGSGGSSSGGAVVDSKTAAAAADDGKSDGFDPAGVRIVPFGESGTDAPHHLKRIHTMFRDGILSNSKHIPEIYASESEYVEGCILDDLSAIPANYQHNHPKGDEHKNCPRGNFFVCLATPTPTAALPKPEPEIIGMVALQYVDRLHAEVRRMSVLSTVRRLGIGRRLVAHMLEYGRAQGFTTIVLNTLEYFPANRLYSGVGFTRFLAVPIELTEAVGGVHMVNEVHYVYYYDALGTKVVKSGVDSLTDTERKDWTERLAKEKSWAIQFEAQKAAAKELKTKQKAVLPSLASGAGTAAATTTTATATSS